MMIGEHSCFHIILPPVLDLPLSSYGRVIGCAKRKRAYQNIVILSALARRIFYYSDSSPTLSMPLF